MRRRRRGKLKLDRSGPWIAVAGMFVLLWLAVTTAAYAPWWGVVLHVLALVPLAVWTSRWVRTRPRASMLVPVVGLVVLAGITALGLALGDWGR